LKHAGRFQFTPLAFDDLESIVAHIAQDNLEAAIRVESAILDACKLLARNPLLGSKRSDVTPLPLRFWPVSRFPNYTIVYLPAASPLKVLAVVHGMREMKRILRDR
jgi:plasmid stabilization system protein ParE